MFKKEQLFGIFLCTLLLSSTLLISPPTFPTAKAETGGPIHGEGTYENLTGDWTINATDTVYYGNRTLNLTGNLTIYGKLTLQNVTLRFNSTYLFGDHDAPNGVSTAEELTLLSDTIDSRRFIIRYLDR